MYNIDLGCLNIFKLFVLFIWIGLLQTDKQNVIKLPLFAGKQKI